MRQELASSLDDSRLGKFYAKVCDITDERAVEEVFGWVDSALGGVSVLVNNAGIIMRTSLLGKRARLSFYLYTYM